MEQRSFINVILVYLLVSVSGSLFYKFYDLKYLLFAFFISLVAWFVYSDKKVNEKFVLYVAIFTGFLLVINLYTDGSLSIATVLSLAMKLVMAYLIMKTVGRNFVKTYTDLIVFLAAFSLFGYATDQYHLFNGLIQKLPQIGAYGYDGILYAYRYYYAGFSRNNSIFFEPGAYQAFLNAALFMLFFARTEYSSRRKTVYVLILLVTLYTTYSTTGFLIFSVMCGLFILGSQAISTSGKIGLVGFVIVAVLIFSVEFKEVIIDKLYNYTQIEDVTDSGHGHRRSFDLLVDMEIFKRNIFGVGYREYFDLFSYIGLKGGARATSSNGISKTFAIFGLPFGLFLFGSFYWALHKLLGGGVVAVVSFGMLLMFFMGEAYYVFTPVCLGIIAAAFVYSGQGIESRRLVDGRRTS